MQKVSMESPKWKPNLLKNTLVRLLSFAVLIFATRFAYFVTVRGGSCSSNDFCFFLDTIRFRGSAIGVRNVPEVTLGGEIPTRDLWTTEKRQRSVDYYASIFQDLVAEGFLSYHSKALCVESHSGEDVLALKEIGVVNAVGISRKKSMPLVVSGVAYRQPFKQDTFDFEFSGDGGLDQAVRPVDFASEIGRTLKPGGFAVIHTRAAKDDYSFNSFFDLFNCCLLIRSREIDGINSSLIREIVMNKEIEIFDGRVTELSHKGNPGRKCSIPGYMSEIIRNAEPLIEEEPLKPWITLKRNIKNIKYLSSMVDISFKQRYVYVDVGARSYGSSIGSWFRKQYPKQNKKFDVYAIEADKTFHEEYRTKKGVTLLPYAAWVRNETLFFEITRDPSKRITGKRKGFGRIQPVQSSASYMGDIDKIHGFDFANWLRSTVSERDFVVMKMDVEGTEFHLIPRLIETGDICLIDEIFLECHYNKWQRCCPGQRSVKHPKTYTECLNLFTSLRKSGVLVHQWW